MPLIYSIEKKDNYFIILWDVLEKEIEVFSSLYLGFLSENEQEILLKLGPKRKKEFLGIRYILKHFYPELNLRLSYNEKGAPFFINAPLPLTHLSISHSNGKIALGISKYKIGIDIQERKKKQITRIQKKFIRKDEHTFIDPLYQTEQLHIIWGVKESLYKLTNGHLIGFLKNYKVLPFNLDQNEVRCQIISTSSIDYTLKARYKIIGDHFLVYVINNKEK